MAASGRPSRRSEVCHQVLPVGVTLKWLGPSHHFNTFSIITSASLKEINHTKLFDLETLIFGKKSLLVIITLLDTVKVSLHLSL